MECSAPPTAEQVARTIAATVTPISDGTYPRMLSAPAGLPCTPDTSAHRSPGRRDVGRDLLIHVIRRLAVLVQSNYKRDGLEDAMNLELEFSYRAEVKMPLTVGPGPYGTRLFFEVVSGSFEGKRLKGKVLSGGGDWLLAGEDGFARLDVRAQFLTDDGATIYGSYGGLLQMTPKVQAALADPKGSTDFADQYFRTTPRFETGDPRYAWLNQCVFVSEGRILPGRTVEYKCYRVL